MKYSLTIFIFHLPYKFLSIFSALETLQSNRRHSIFFQKVNLNEMVMCLEDLINYFSQPPDDMGLYMQIYSLTS